MRFRLPFLPALLLVALLTGGADGCSSDPNVEGAKLNLRAEEYDEALTNLDAALETNPDNVEALRIKAEVLARKLDRAPMAERGALVEPMQMAIMRAVQLAPDDVDVTQMRAFTWATVMNKGNQSLQNDATPPADAIPFFEGAIAINPDSVGGTFGLGLAQLLSGDAAASIPSFERAVELEPDYTNAYIYLSKAYIQEGRGADAVDILATARTMISEGDADRERLEQEYLNTLATSGQTDRAISEFEQQIENYPDDALIRYNYGTLLLGVDRYADAIEQFEMATELEEENADAYYNLGVAYLREAGRIETEAGALDLSQQDQYDAMIAQRDEQIEMSLTALVTARDLTTDDNRPTVCSTLLTIYNSLGRADDAAAAAECAGMEMN